VADAPEAGYPHIVDTAAAYGTQSETGYGIARQDIVAAANQIELHP
jgi:diketogulonate reductase-like aldo/keto reductase